VSSHGRRWCSQGGAYTPRVRLKTRLEIVIRVEVLIINGFSAALLTAAQTSILPPHDSSGTA
jgi:hypothetical protein